jgi:Ca-activated chloride channel family protein
VESFRLLGFENREISHQDFTDDKVISEPVGSGGYGVALYELVLRDGSGPVESGYKYAKVVTTGSKELGTVKIRYKEPLADTSEEIEYVIPSAEDGFTDNLRLAYVVYVCAEKLRGSDKICREDLELAEKLCDTLGEEIREINKDDFYKLPEILKRSARDLNKGIHSRDPFEW